MYLKSLTLRGFKSFASATTLVLEPGITCVVGPNGSGKSNVVDALAWVMGEQGAKSLRGGKMEDVIFAGTSGPAGRAPLGRAEVSLTIDNTDGALPIDYTEVTISRTMFRGGGSEYTINGASCRLLDVQELLSDSGIGREMHVIVGQGQLDAVLRATPEERRGFIEEAAGVLKHRKRKEKAIRKLDAMQANLHRITDLTAEIRRQLGPLGRQAEVARRAVAIQSDARDARLRLVADDLAQVQGSLGADQADESALRARRAEVAASLAAVSAGLAQTEQCAAEQGPILSQCRDTWFAFSRLHEQFTSTERLAAERLRLLAAVGSEPVTRDPEQLSRQAAELRAQEAALRAEIAGLSSALQAGEVARADCEGQLAAEQRRLAQAQRTSADRREALARLKGQIAARTSRIEAAESEIARLTTASGQALERAAQAQTESAQVNAQIQGYEHGEEGLNEEYELASEAERMVQAEVTELLSQQQAAQAEQATSLARRDALQLSLNDRDGAAAVLATAPDQVLGSLANLVRITTGYESAVAAALGPAAEAVVAQSWSTAVELLAWLKEESAGQSALVVADLPRHLSPPAKAPPVLGALPLRSFVTGPPTITQLLDQLLAEVYLVDSLDPAMLPDNLPGRRILVTAEGDWAGPAMVKGGSAGAPSTLETQAAAEEAASRAVAAGIRAEQAASDLVHAGQRAEEAGVQMAESLERLHASDAALAAVAERLSSLAAISRSAAAEAERIQRDIHAASSAVTTDRGKLAELTGELATAETESIPAAEPDPQVRANLEEQASAARMAETEARLALRTAEERLRALGARVHALERAAAEQANALRQAQLRQQKRHREAAIAQAVQQAVAWLKPKITNTLAQAQRELDQAETARLAAEESLSQGRARLRELETEHRELTDSVHRDEVARTQLRIRLEQLEAKARELSMEPDELVAEFGPHLPVPHRSQDTGDDGGDPDIKSEAYVRERQEKRLRTAERALKVLGKVNPLALEEFAALEERHKFLHDQLQDLQRSRRDLVEIIKEVDERVEQVFTSAFHDTAAQFERVFARVFPGGEGRLVLTEPSDMLTTGIEVEARPPGKKVKRLSLLSGGERSLTAVALLVAIFKARPSPFYVMDEVEAALDDTNLGRLLVIMEELRESSQLIVITHQKRTMEVADALYGVTMRGDGVTTVISQRIRGSRPGT